MSAFFLRDPDCVFLHIPKTGGSTIREGLWQGRWQGPAFGHVPTDWPPTFRFAFVREPIDRFLSAYRDFVQLRGFVGDLDRFIDIALDESIDHVEARPGLSHQSIRHHTAPQTDPSLCLASADFIGRYERYAEDLAHVLDRLNWDAPAAPRLRQTDIAPIALSAEQIARLASFYAQDYAELGYARPDQHRSDSPMSHDFSLHSGERQTAASYEGIRADHRFRYEWADQRISADTRGLDVFCGNGYGAWLLGQRRTVLGVDGSVEAVAFAREHYVQPSVTFVAMEWPFPLAPARQDFVVSLESIEHVADGAGMLAALAATLRPCGDIVFSTPNLDQLPLAGFKPFHHRHFSLAETLTMAEASGLDVQQWAGQTVYRQGGGLVSEREMALTPYQPGQFTIVHAKRR